MLILAFVRTKDGRYMFNDSGKIQCFHEHPEDSDFWEVQIEKGKISFRTNGKYLSADKGGICMLSDQATDSESFTIVEGKNREYGFQSCHGKFLTSSKQSGCGIYNTSADMKDNETFLITPKLSKCCALKSHFGKYLKSETETGVLLSERRTSVAFLSFFDTKDQESHRDPRARIVCSEKTVLAADDKHVFWTGFENSVNSKTRFSLHPGKTLGTLALETPQHKMLTAGEFEVTATKAAIGDAESWTVEYIQ